MKLNKKWNKCRDAADAFLTGHFKWLAVFLVGCFQLARSLARTHSLCGVEIMNRSEDISHCAVWVLSVTTNSITTSTLITNMNLTVSDSWCLKISHKMNIIGHGFEIRVASVFFFCCCVSFATIVATLNWKFWNCRFCTFIFSFVADIIYLNFTRFWNLMFEFTQMKRSQNGRQRKKWKWVIAVNICLSYWMINSHKYVLFHSWNANFVIELKIPAKMEFIG